MVRSVDYINIKISAHEAHPQQEVEVYHGHGLKGPFMGLCNLVSLVTRFLDPLEGALLGHGTHGAL